MDEDARTTIAIAEGILVERHRMTPAEAAQLLADLARADDLSLVESAEWVILLRWPLA
ncbi:ANTAR domain-containing protein [Kribbella sp. CWNU-51]